MVLVCEHGICTGNHGMVFQLIGCCFRLVRLLGLDTPRRSQSDASSEDRIQAEVERRLVWSCYILDNLVGSGVDGNLSWPTCPRIPLPVGEHEFVSGSIPEQSQLATPLAFGDQLARTKLNLRSNIIYLLSLRTQVLR